MFSRTFWNSFANSSASLSCCTVLRHKMSTDQRVELEYVSMVKELRYTNHAAASKGIQCNCFHPTIICYLVYLTGFVKRDHNLHFYVNACPSKTHISATVILKIKFWREVLRQQWCKNEVLGPYHLRITRWDSWHSQLCPFFFWKRDHYKG